MRPTEPLVVGWREWVRLPALLPAEWVKVKVDTGAKTSAIHAWDVTRESRDGVPWVRFQLHPRQHDDAHVVTAAAPLLEERSVRSSNGEVELRPVIEADVVLGDLRHRIELTLTNRDQMGFRMLLGRRGLAGWAVVDPGASYRLGGDRHRPPDG